MPNKEAIGSMAIVGNSFDHAQGRELDNGPQEIGRGRSGVVYRTKNSAGQDLACKVFDSRGFTKFVQWITLGAPNPYMWNQDAVQCAKIRRNILSLLVPVWTKGEVTVADAETANWNEKHATFELNTRFVAGRPAALHHTLREEQESEAAILWKRVMPDLRNSLQFAGFEGLLWQAGIGNPVALNNFLYERTNKVQRGGPETSRHARWVWIDLESGVPAIFPISPLVFIRYSLSNWWKSGRPLFDDVNIDRLEDYLQSDTEDLRSALGDENYESIKRDVARLSEHQRKWKSLGRISSSIQYRFMQGEIGEDEADYYRNHQFRWIIKELRRAPRSALSLIQDLLASAYRRWKQIDILGLIRKCSRFLMSQRFREEFVHGYLDGRVASWVHREQMSEKHAKIFRQQIGSPDSSVYITDFGIHLAIKPAVKTVQYFLLPGLFALGLLSGVTVALLIVSGGAIGRTAYTSARIIQSTRQNYERPWIAMVVGVLPVVGNLAFPVQMLYSVHGRDQNLARFMLDDAFARIGQVLPIWGGIDTWTEHVLNRLPSKTVRYRANKRQAAGIIQALKKRT